MGGVDVFTIFFGLFWAAVMASCGRYRLFSTHLLTTSEYQTTARRRLLVGITFVNLMPIGLFVIVAANLPPETDWWSRAAGAIAALSVFGITRIVHGIVYTRFRDNFYSEIDPRSTDDWNELGPQRRMWSHTWPGLAYLMLPVLIVTLGELLLDPLVN